MESVKPAFQLKPGEAHKELLRPHNLPTTTYFDIDFRCLFALRDARQHPLLSPHPSLPPAPILPAELQVPPRDERETPARR